MSMANCLCREDELISREGNLVWINRAHSPAPPKAEKGSLYSP